MSKRKFLALIMAILVLVVSLSTTAFAADNNFAAGDGKVYVPFNGEVYTYDSLEEAINDVGEEKVTLYLVGDDELATDVEIAAGQTLVIATSDNYEADNTKTGNNTSAAQEGDSAYSTLTVLSGATLIVNGTLSWLATNIATLPMRASSPATMERLLWTAPWKSMARCMRVVQFPVKVR